MTTQSQARAIWKAILRHHPFFKSGGTFGWDYRTMIASGYAADAAILRAAIQGAQ